MSKARRRAVAPRVIGLLVGVGSRSPWDVFTDTSPADMLPIGVPQAIVSGALDPIVPPAFGSAYAAKAVAAGDSVQELTIADAGHFELIDPEFVGFRKNQVAHRAKAKVSSRRLLRKYRSPLPDFVNAILILGQEDEHFGGETS